MPTEQLPVLKHFVIASRIIDKVQFSCIKNGVEKLSEVIKLLDDE